MQQGPRGEDVVAGGWQGSVGPGPSDDSHCGHAGVCHKSGGGPPLTPCRMLARAHTITGASLPLSTPLSGTLQGASRCRDRWQWPGPGALHPGAVPRPGPAACHGNCASDTSVASSDLRRDAPQDLCQHAYSLGWAQGHHPGKGAFVDHLLGPAFSAALHELPSSLRAGVH